MKIAGDWQVAVNLAVNTPPPKDEEKAAGDRPEADENEDPNPPGND